MNWYHLKEISETLKNTVEALAICGAVFAWWKWVGERNDRAIDVLKDLETRFTDPELQKARRLVDNDANYEDLAPILGQYVLVEAASAPKQPLTEEQLNLVYSLDMLLRFYVYLYGVREAKQVPDSALRACYRYWLTFYYHPRRTALRAYVDWFFPTVSAWLRQDERNARKWSRRILRRKRFFNPKEFGWVDSEREKLTQLRRAFRGRLLVVTGAGISAESGLSTFRGEKGYWRNLDPQQLATQEAFEENPQLVWDWYNGRRQAIRECQANAAHVALIALAQQCRTSEDFLLLTQNVDDLHERAELNSCKLSQLQIVHIHGNIFVSHCSNTTCHFQRLDREPPEDSAPNTLICPKCSHLLRPGVVWFDENISLEEETRVEGFLTRGGCDVVLVIGTTATFDYIRRWILRAVMDGAWLIEINPNKTGLSQFAHHVIRNRATTGLRRLLRGAGDRTQVSARRSIPV